MRSAGSEPNLGMSLIKIIRLPQVGQFELLVFWPSMLRYGTTAPLTERVPKTVAKIGQRAFSSDAKPF